MKETPKPRQPLRVAMIIHSYHPVVGGAEKQLGAIVPILKKRGLEVHILTRRHKGLQAEETIDGVKVHRLPVPGPKPLAAIVFIIAVVARLRKIHPQILHAHEMFSTSTAALLAKKLLHAAVVVTPHSSGPQGDVQRLQKKIFGKQRMDLFRANVDAFVVISHEIQEELLGAGVPANRCKHIPNGVDTSLYRPLSALRKGSLRRKMGFSSFEKLILFTGRLVKLKKVDELISVWPAILSAFPSAKLLIVGSGPEEKELRDLASEGVIFTREVKNPIQYLQSADLFVLPSSIEGLSLALMEAMACGLPVLATSVGGNVDLIQHAHNGMLVPTGDRLALKNGLINLISDKKLSQELGRNARRTILQNFNLERMADSLVMLYQHLSGGWQ